MNLLKILFLLLVIVTGHATAGGDESGGDEMARAFQVYLVRHAEKEADGGSDPCLTAAGEQRANALADWLSGRGLAAVWSSDYRRTRDTAAPTATLLGMQTRLYDPRDGEHIAALLRHESRNALVVGHSNTIPALAALLCACETEEMGESEYDRLYVIGFSGDIVSLEVLNQSGLERPD